MDNNANTPLPRPPWIRVRIGQNGLFEATKARVHERGLHTVCESAFCPNMGKCWAHGRATIMILGDRCTRRCRFCNVDKKTVLPPDPDEPAKVAAAVKETGLREVVITSVTRDDLPDGGAGIWADTVSSIRRAVPSALIEVLVPDFKGDRSAIDTVLDAGPDVFGHNLETVPRLYPEVRPQANYQRSLAVLRQASERGFIVKTSLMLGLGENLDEIKAVLADARQSGCSIFYAGQYLQPSQKHLPVARYVTPEEFDIVKQSALAAGFGFVASSPLVRSSYHEQGQTEFVLSKREPKE
ncbi:MAG: lipoyl synthase [Kiritimatiellae bacterium]|nr:lipoyl synthase [Kiritimatiellia bacterium]